MTEPLPASHIAEFHEAKPQAHTVMNPMQW